MTCATAEIFADSGVCRKQALAVLSRLGIVGAQLAAAMWEAKPPCADVCTGRMRMEGLMLTIWFPLAVEKFAAGNAWDMLLRNGSAGPGVKLVLTAPNWRPVLIGEAFLGGEEPQIESRIVRLWDDLTAFFAAPKVPSDAAAALDLAAMCEEAGWESVRRDDSISVRLESDRRGAGVQAAAIPFTAVVAAEGGGVRCAVELAAGDSPPPEPNRTALAAMLLQVGAQIRLVRPAAAAADGRCAVRLEALLGPDAGAPELGESLSALSVAVRICGPEAALLHNDAQIAQEFMQMRCPDAASPGLSSCAS